MLTCRPLAELNCTVAPRVGESPEGEEAPPRGGMDTPRVDLREALQWHHTVSTVKVNKSDVVNF